MTYYCTPTGMAKIQNLTVSIIDEYVEQELPFIAGGNAKCYNHFEIYLAISYNAKHNFTGNQIQVYPTDLKTYIYIETAHE